MLTKLLNNKHFKYGAPFLIVVVGGSFGLQFYSQFRYDLQKERKITTKTKQLQDLIAASKPITVEEAYEEYTKTVDLDNWKNIRGPRPWEDKAGNEDFREAIEKRASDSKKGWIFR